MHFLSITHLFPLLDCWLSPVKTPPPLSNSQFHRFSSAIYLPASRLCVASGIHLKCDCCSDPSISSFASLGSHSLSWKTLVFFIMRCYLQSNFCLFRAIFSFQSVRNPVSSFLVSVILEFLQVTSAYASYHSILNSFYSISSNNHW